MQAATRRSTRIWAAILALSILLCTCLHASTEVPAGARFAEPSGNGDKTIKKSGTTIDYGNASDGYIMVKQEKGKLRYKMKVSCGDDTLTYDLNNNGDYEVFPLQLGSGKYKIQVFKQVKGTSYSPVSSSSFKAKLSSKSIVYLYPNQYAWYTEMFNCVAKSAEVCDGLKSDKEKMDAVFKWCSSRISYDYILAMTVKAGYIPDVDEVVEKQMAICFGYAAVMACMLRTQGVPTQLVIGYADNTYHAWNNVLIDDKWVRKDATFASTNATAKKYTEERKY